ncbi:MAG TPA: PadR family transcriptional regulator [Gemmatimonadales bacterium]|nr:PadR family transcriptional regulator [Gemmatimonadales bacterium]
MKRSPSDLLQGSVEMLILRALAWQTMHGYAIARWIASRTDDVLSVETAALYQALHRLERRGLVAASWGVSENNRRAKYYELTQAGRHALRAESETWRLYASAVARVLDPA